jgi:phage/conjugal plasmid C-4 type zinc finger TraR family protein
MDEIDEANDRAEQFNAEAVRAARAKLYTAPSSGICQSCGDEIEPERLRANPTARSCRDCASAEEAAKRRARRVGG